jgi:hypothetical protein
VLLLDATYRPHFGDAALYTDDRSAQDWVDLHTARPAVFVEQQQRAQAFLERHLSATALQATVAGLFPPRARG